MRICWSLFSDFVCRKSDLVIGSEFDSATSDPDSQSKGKWLDYVTAGSRFYSSKLRIRGQNIDDIHLQWVGERGLWGNVRV
jgi:hypothetical protein